MRHTTIAMHGTDVVDIVLLGFGKVGRELAAQLAAGVSADYDGLPWLRVVAVMDRMGMAFDQHGFSVRHIASLSMSKERGASLDRTIGRIEPPDALRILALHGLSRPILVDLTASDTGAILRDALDHGMDLVLANKRPLVEPNHTDDTLLDHAMHRGRRVLYGATVGAGLPIIDMLRKLLQSGDKVRKIEGCASGTVGYILEELEHGARFSDAVRRAMEQGYTEPDPRDDLSGMDVARKALILARMLGYNGDLADIRVESLVPAHSRDVPLDEFLARLPEGDALWAKRIAVARMQHTVLRYRMTVTSGGGRVQLASVDPTSMLGALRGTDNQFAFTTARYKENPLVITGPGAGLDVTVGGVLNDIHRLGWNR